MKVFFGVFLLIAMGTSATADELPISGFAFWTLDKESVQRGHVWLISQYKIMPQVEAFAIIAPLGPPKILHNLQVTWQHPYGKLTAGRFTPPISREWHDTRFDRLPTIFYSSIATPLVARDVGIEASSVLQSFTGKIGVFAGERMGGNVPISERGKPDFYASGRFEPSSWLSLGLGERFGPVKVSAADVLVKVRSFTAAAELVSSDDVLLYHYLLGYITPRLSTITRYEHLAKGARKWTIGCAYKPVDAHEFKLNYIVDVQQENEIVGQCVLRW